MAAGSRYNGKMGSSSQGRTGSKAALSAFSLRLLVEKIPAVLWTTDIDFPLTSVAGGAPPRVKFRPQGLPRAFLLQFFDRASPAYPPPIFAPHARGWKGGTRYA